MHARPCGRGRRTATWNPPRERHFGRSCSEGRQRPCPCQEGTRVTTSWPSRSNDRHNGGASRPDEEIVAGNPVTSRRPDDLPTLNCEMVALLTGTEPDQAGHQLASGAGLSHHGPAVSDTGEVQSKADNNN